MSRSVYIGVIHCPYSDCGGTVRATATSVGEASLVELECSGPDRHLLASAETHAEAWRWFAEDYTGMLDHPSTYETNRVRDMLARQDADR